MNDRTLMGLRADTLFTYDPRGRMLTSNEPREDARRPAPRLFLGSSRDGYVARFGAGLPDTLVGELETLLQNHLPGPDLRPPPPVFTAVREILERNAPVAAAESGPAYRFPATIATPRDVVRLTPENRELLRGPFRWLYDEIDHWQPSFAVVDAGAAVSVCFGSRISTVVEAGVDTLAEFRGRGHAAAVTAAWGAAVRASGRIPVYSTTWENAASQGVARRLGLVLVGADASWA